MKVATRLFLLALFGLSLCSPSLVARPGGGISMTLEDRLPAGVQNKAVDQFVRADVVVVGKVKSIEENCRVASAASTDVYKSAYRVAVVEVKENVLGSKAGETLRVGFRAAHNPTYKERELREGDEGVFFLNKHHEESFLVIKQPFTNPFGNFGGGFGGGFGGAFNGGVNLGGGQLGNPPADKQPAQPAKPPRATEFMGKELPDYDKNLALVRRCGKLYAGGKASLKSANAGDRLLAAAVLVGKHRNLAPTRTYQSFGVNLAGSKSEPIDAEESKLILDVLSASNLEQLDTETGVFPLGVFKRLGLKREDNWTAPTTNQRDYAAAAQRWLHANANSYRVQRVVEEKTTPVSINEKPALSSPATKEKPPEGSPNKGAGGGQPPPKANGPGLPAPTFQNQPPAQPQAKEGPTWLTLMLVTGGAVLLTAAASVGLTLMAARKPAPPPAKKRRRVKEDEE
jgi:hypothetical protein